MPLQRKGVGSTVQGSEISIPSQAQGDLLFRDGSTWTRLAAGTSGNFLKTQGAGANPTWAAASGNYSLVSETTVSVATNSISFTSLDINTDFMYVFVIKVTNDNASNTTYSIEFNGDSTASNYHVQKMAASGSSADNARANNSIIGQSDQNKNNVIVIKVWKSTDGSACWEGGGVREIGTGIARYMTAGAKTNATVANITQVDFTSSQSTGYGVDTTITLFKVDNA